MFQFIFIQCLSIMTSLTLGMGEAFTIIGYALMIERNKLAVKRNPDLNLKAEIPLEHLTHKGVN